jgi:transcriptional regulator with XRE-family HTH domain
MEDPILAPMPQTLQELARAQIQKWIVGTGITQTELAARIDRNQAWMSRYLKEAYDADLEDLNRMAQVFGHTLAQLFQLPIDPEEAALISGYRAMKLEARKHVFGLVQELSRGKGKPRARGRSR